MTDKQKLELINNLVCEAFEGVSDKSDSGERNVGFLLGLFAAIDRIIRAEEEQ